jgi:hypothetical protein
VVAALVGLRARQRHRAARVDRADGLEWLRGLRVVGLGVGLAGLGLRLGLGLGGLRLGVGLASDGFGVERWLRFGHRGQRLGVGLVGERLPVGLVGRFLRERRRRCRRVARRQVLRRLAPLAQRALALALKARGLAIGRRALAALVAPAEQRHQPATSPAWRASQSSSSTAAARESSLVWPLGARAAIAVVKRSS